MRACSSAQLNLNWLKSVTAIATTKCLNYIHPEHTEEKRKLKSVHYITAEVKNIIFR